MIDLLCFAEDPGAANYLAQTLNVMTCRGISYKIFSVGLAVKYLLDRKIENYELSGTEDVDEILDSSKPKIILIGTSENQDSIGLGLIKSAKSKSIPSVGIIDAAMHSAFRFRGRSNSALTYAPDWLMVQDEWTKQSYIQLGYPSQRIAVCGNPHYDYVLQSIERLRKMDSLMLKNRIFPDIRKNQKALVFVSEGSDKLSRMSPKQLIVEGSLTGRGISEGRMEIIIEELLDAVRLLPQKPYLVLRPHPKDKIDDYELYSREFDYIDNQSLPLELVYISDLVVGATSILLQEASIMGRPTLSIIPRIDEKEWLWGIRTGAIPCVSTKHELTKAIFQFFYENKSIQNETNITFPLRSTERVVSFIESIISHRIY